MNERFPTSLNQERQEASNLYHGLCLSSRNHSHIDWQVYDTAYLRKWRLSGCTLSFNSLKSPLLKKCLNGLIHTEQITSSSLVVHLKLKCLLKKPTHDDIIEAKEVNIQQAFGRYKGKLVLRN